MPRLKSQKLLKIVAFIAIIHVFAFNHLRLDLVFVCWECKRNTERNTKRNDEY